MSLNSTPSLFDDGQIGTGSISQPMTAKATSTTNLVDLLHDGFYIVFLLKNKYIPTHPAQDNLYAVRIGLRMRNGFLTEPVHGGEIMHMMVRGIFLSTIKDG